MKFLIIIILIYAIYKLSEDARMPYVPEGSYRNIRLMNIDSWKVTTGEMSKAQFRKNIRDGKYRMDKLNYNVHFTNGSKIKVEAYNKEEARTLAEGLNKAPNCEAFSVEELLY